MNATGIEIRMLTNLLRSMVANNGSDLFITARFPPAIKVDGIVSGEAAALTAGAHRRCSAARDERQAGGRVRGDEGVQLRASARAGVGRFRVNGFVQQGRVGMVLRARSRTQIPTLRRAGAAADAEGRRDDQARPHALRRRHRLGQVDHARGDDRLPQRELATATSSRSRTRSSSCTRTRTASSRSAKSASTPTPGRRAEEHAAPGARRDPDRRDPRRRDDGARDRVRRNRPPVPRHAAREQRQPGARPHHQLLPGRARATSC